MGGPRTRTYSRFMSDTNKQLSAHFTELFTTGDRATVEQILSADFVLHLADRDVEGRDDRARRGRPYRRGLGLQGRSRSQAADGRDVGSAGDDVRRGAGESHGGDRGGRRSGRPPEEVRDELLPRLNRAVPFDAAFWATTDPGTLLFTQAHQQALPPETIPAFLANEFGGEDANPFAELAVDMVGVGTLAAATEGVLQRSPRHNEILAPLGLGDELRAVLRRDGVVWGVLSCIARLAGRSRPMRRASSSASPRCWRTGFGTGCSSRASRWRRRPRRPGSSWCPTAAT